MNETRKSLTDEWVECYGDAEEPFKMVIYLEDGRCILATKCQYQLVSKE